MVGLLAIRQDAVSLGRLLRVAEKCVMVRKSRNRMWDWKMRNEVLRKGGM